MCIVLNKLSEHTFTIQKSLLYTLFRLFLKSSKAFNVTLIKYLFNILLKLISYYYLSQCELLRVSFRTRKTKLKLVYFKRSCSGPLHPAFSDIVLNSEDPKQEIAV